MAEKKRRNPVSKAKYISPHQQRFLTVDLDGFTMGNEDENEEIKGETDNKYSSSNIILAGNLLEEDIYVTNLTDEVIAQNEALLINSEENKPLEQLILDATTMVQRYIRPEKDLLEFNGEDIAAIEQYYIKAYALLDDLIQKIN